MQMTEYDIIKKYKEEMMLGLQHSFPGLSITELNDAMDYHIIQNCKNGKAVIDNNYTNKKIDTTVLEVLEYIKQCEPIVTSSGVLFKKHKDTDNPLARMIRKFVDLRDVHKAEMFKYPKGSELYQRYNLFQILDKVDANA